MPTLYRIIRENSHQPTNDLPVGAVGGVVFSEKNEGEIVSSYLALLSPNGLVPLRHPIEDNDIKANGETFQSANSKGILFYLESHICADCGFHVHIPNLRYHRLRGGCLLSLIAGFFIVFSGVFLFHWKLGNAFFVFWFISILLWCFSFFVSTFIGKRKFRDNIKTVQITSCPQCGNTKFIPIGKIGKKGIVLKNGSKLHVDFAGIS